MKPVGPSTMFHILLTRQMCPKAVYLCSTSLLPMMTKLANAKRMTLHAEVTPDFAAWKEQQISKGVKGIEERDNMVNDYMDRKRKPKNPDPLGPPVSYMEERGVFQPLASTTNPLGLCHFYRADSNVSAPKTPKPPATVEHVKKLLLLASTQRQSYVIVVFQGGTVTPLGLLQELHTRSVLVRIPICLPGETKDGHRPRACRVVHSARTPSKTIRPTLTILSACITTRALDVEPALVLSPPLANK